MKISRTFTDEAIEEVQRHYDELSAVSNEDLIMIALAAILEEQYRTGHRSPGWPPLRDHAIRGLLEDRSGSSRDRNPNLHVEITSG